MRKYCLGGVLYFLLRFCYGEVQIYQPDDYTEMHKCVEMILQRTEDYNARDVTLVNVDEFLTMKLHSQLKHPVRFISRSFYWPNDTMFNDVYVIWCADFFIFARGLDSVKRYAFWNPRAKFVIIVEDIADHLIDASAFLMHNHIYDVALVAYDENQNTMVYTFGLEHDECDRPVFRTLRLLSRCSEIHNFPRIYVAVRKTDLRGCHVKFVSHNYWPFVSFEDERAIEPFLLRLIKQYEGITVELIDHGKVEDFGTRLKNFTYTGMLHEIEIYKVEGAVGGYRLTYNRMLNMDFIDPYMTDKNKIVIRRAQLLNKWFGVLKQLGLLTVWAVFGTFGIACAVVIFMEIFKTRRRDTSRDILIIWGYFLGNICQKQSSRPEIPYRLVLLSILLFVIIISCAIQASLLSATTQPIRDYQLNEVEEVVSNYELLVSPSQYSYFLSGYAFNVTKAVTSSCKITLECMMKVMTETDKKLYTLASDIYHQSYTWKFADSTGELKIYKLKESVGTILQTMYIRRGSSLAEPFNRLLLRTRSAGLIDHFIEKLFFTERVKYKFRTRRTKRPQSLKGLYGVFMVLIYGYCISLISFIVEYLHYRKLLSVLLCYSF